MHIGCWTGSVCVEGSDHCSMKHFSSPKWQSMLIVAGPKTHFDMKRMHLQLGLLRLEHTVELCTEGEVSTGCVCAQRGQDSLVASMMLPLTLSLPDMNAFCPLSFPSAICDVIRRGVEREKTLRTWTHTHVDKDVVGRVDGDVGLGALLDGALVGNGVLAEGKQGGVSGRTRGIHPHLHTFLRSIV